MCAVVESSRVGLEAFAESPSSTEGGQSPPYVSERDRAVYEAVCIEGRAAARVAEELGLSATTVRNLAAATQRNLARRQFDLERTTCRETLVLLVDRLEQQWRDAREAWRESKNPRTTTTTRYRDEGDLIDTKRVSQCGEVRYLVEARRTLKELTAARMQLDAWDRAADWEAGREARLAAEEAEKQAFLAKFGKRPAVAKVVSDAPQTPAEQTVAAPHLPAPPAAAAFSPAFSPADLADPAVRAEFKRQMIAGLGPDYDLEDDALIEEVLDQTIADLTASRGARETGSAPRRNEAA